MSNGKCYAECFAAVPIRGSDCRTLRGLTLIDEYRRECLCGRPRTWVRQNRGFAAENESEAGSPREPVLGPRPQIQGKRTVLAV